MTAFSVWAPEAGRVDAEVAGQAYPMSALSGRPGWWTAQADAPAGTDYAFRLDGGEPLPDPRSPRQPYGPGGASRTYDQDAFAWTDDRWRGASIGGAVIYELHVGTFTAEGTLDAAIGRLDYLVSLGVTVVELMPVAAFPGEHGWGYDGIGLWAVHEPYGGPDALKRFVDACHGRGLGVFLDVVYNHVGPGNQLASFGPYFTDVYATPWGPAVNLDQPGSDEVRSFIVGNALMWLRDYHFDGLRLDAVHAFQDHRAVHVLEELAAAVDGLAAASGRSLVLVAESDMNNPRLVTPREAGGYGLSAQWDDDFHHTVHALVTGERQGYYADFGPIAGLAKVLTGAYFHDGTWSSFRDRAHGRPVDTLRTPGYRFVVFDQDHDQVGNRAVGDRLPATLAGHPHRDGLLRVAAGLVLMSPYTPMLFMGEEWGADTPWQFFTDHTDPFFAEAVSNGRRSEFAAHGWGFADVPDPQDKETFLRSKLDWAQPDREPYHSLLGWYRSLLALRRARPELTDPRLDHVRAEYSEDDRWLVMHRGPLRVAANLGDTAAAIPVPGAAAILLASQPGIAVDAAILHLPPATFTVIDSAKLRQIAELPWRPRGELSAVVFPSRYPSPSAIDLPDLGCLAAPGDLGDEMEPLGRDDPRKIGTYELIACLGEGGMGSVYLGKSPTGLLVAVKVVRSSLAADESFRKRFLREMDAMRRVGGGYVAELLDCDRLATQPWLATRFVVGATLGDLVRPRDQHGNPLPPRPMPPGGGWWLAFGLVKALAAIHASGIVHRDLKPANIMLSPYGPRVIDFGIATGLTGSGFSDPPITLPGMRIGTPQYMSPEQHMAFPVGALSDVYSLGAVLVVALTGAEPRLDGFNRPNWERILPSVPAELRGLIRGCLAADPKDRPALDTLLTVTVRETERYPHALPSWWPQPLADQVNDAADHVFDSLTPGEGRPRVTEHNGWEQWYIGGRRTSGESLPQQEIRPGLDGVFYPAYRAAARACGSLGSRAGQGADAAGYAAEGDRHMERNRYTDAVDAYRASLRLDPGNAVVWNDLGRALCGPGRMKEAERAFARALEINPGLVAALRNRYLAIYKMGGAADTAQLEGERLQEACNDVLRCSPGSAAEYSNLGDAYRTFGDPALGASAYQAALALDPGNPWLSSRLG